ncbi:hypothetical protein ACFOHK_12105 [Falsigemmobacter intermedius]|uniref:Uncharacterized protein n=1 Tax=Falsigemmobacter intermedius TaxID=1553448 RepID=A0A3S3YLC4_9RHOB|nr:hypothetical protein [Falsigemmobacter intermedius]RWY42246.1 hypothetical protein EP867_07650 [Falsigemmobacter intermedius]
MFRSFDFSSWQSALTTVFGLLLMMLIMVGIRIIMMMTIQARQQRMNRQINERLRTLMAAYKVLGGSFTGRLTVDPSHLGGSRRAAETTEPETGGDVVLTETPMPEGEPSQFALERRVQIRDAVEAALSDILLLGTEEMVRMAGQAARDMAAGRPIHTAELVVTLRGYIREALDLEPIPADVIVPAQGPTRPAAAGRGGRSGGERGAGGPGGGGMGGPGGGGGGGGGMGMGMGMGMGRRADE